MLLNTDALRMTVGQSEIGVGGLERIISIDPRNQSSVTLPAFNSDYDVYVVEMTNLIGSVDHFLQVADAGANNVHSTIARDRFDSGTGQNSVSNIGNTFWPLHTDLPPGPSLFDIEGGVRYSGTFWIFDPQNSSLFKSGFWDIHHESDFAAGDNVEGVGAAFYQDTAALTQLVVSVDTGIWQDVPDQLITFYGLNKANPLNP